MSITSGNLLEMQILRSSHGESETCGLSLVICIFTRPANDFDICSGLQTSR